jgi:sec-independent protein translocase protein TatC
MVLGLLSLFGLVGLLVPAAVSFVLLAIAMDLVTREWLEAKRLIFWGLFLMIAFLFSSDPTGAAPTFVSLTTIALFEVTLAVLRWTGN